MTKEKTVHQDMIHRLIVGVSLVVVVVVVLHGAKAGGGNSTYYCKFYRLLSNVFFHYFVWFTSWLLLSIIFRHSTTIL
jgi:hypothetical protein